MKKSLEITETVDEKGSKELVIEFTLASKLFQFKADYFGMEQTSGEQTGSFHDHALKIARTIWGFEQEDGVGLGNQYPPENEIILQNLKAIFLQNERTIPAQLENDVQEIIKFLPDQYTEEQLLSILVEWFRTNVLDVK